MKGSYITMSQEKVDQHKSEKKNRKKLNKKARLQRIAGYACAIVVAALLVAWVGFSVYTKITEPDESELAQDSSELDMDALLNYLNSTQEGTSDQAE